ncbi:hypothetical protein BBJ28_00018884 [Nothophytophthora sp. Chile5]|nr:hypothetical protein BBJ28_00018884 [Nothophytophthora sp. Chile5]
MCWAPFDRMQEDIKFPPPRRVFQRPKSRHSRISLGRSMSLTGSTALSPAELDRRERNRSKVRRSYYRKIVRVSLSALSGRLAAVRSRSHTPH